MHQRSLMYNSVYLNVHCIYICRKKIHNKCSNDVLYNDLLCNQQKDTKIQLNIFIFLSLEIQKKAVAILNKMFSCNRTSMFESQCSSEEEFISNHACLNLTT